jgi:hypothetical protein
MRIADPAVDLAALARPFGCFAEDTVDEPDDLGPALNRAVKAVTSSATAIVPHGVNRNRLVSVVNGRATLSANADVEMWHRPACDVQGGVQSLQLVCSLLRR